MGWGVIVAPGAIYGGRLAVLGVSAAVGGGCGADLGPSRDGPRPFRHGRRRTAAASILRTVGLGPIFYTDADGDHACCRPPVSIRATIDYDGA